MVSVGQDTICLISLRQVIVDYIYSLKVPVTKNRCSKHGNLRSRQSRRSRSLCHWLPSAPAVVFAAVAGGPRNTSPAGVADVRRGLDHAEGGDAVGIDPAELPCLERRHGPPRSPGIYGSSPCSRSGPSSAFCASCVNSAGPSIHGTVPHSRGPGITA
jgi:hypothetical protein